MTSDLFINPITMSFGLLEGYRELLVGNLRKAGLTEQYIVQVCDNMEVDQGLFFVNQPFDSYPGSLFEKTKSRKYGFDPLPEERLGERPG